MPKASNPEGRTHCGVVVIWIDWYPYHVARFKGILSNPQLSGHVIGIQLVGGVGVHEGLKFAEGVPSDLRVETLLPSSSWIDADKKQLSRLLWRKLSELNPDVVLVPGYYTLPGIASAVWAKVHRRASVLMTESTADDHQRSSWREWLKGTLIRNLFDWAVAGGTRHRAYLKQLGFREDRVRGGYDVVANDEIYAQTQSLHAVESSGLGIGKNYFLYVGRFALEKNVATLLNAWLQYRADGGTWPLVLVGAGPTYEDIRATASASPHGEHVHLPGLKRSKELLPYFAFAGCFVLPSTREPWGLVVNEAMAAGLPVLVSNRCGSAADLVKDGENGFTFDPGSQEELTSLLARMEHLTSEQRDRFSAQSLEIIRDYSPEHFGREVAFIWNAVAATSESARCISVAEVGQ